MQVKQLFDLTGRTALITGGSRGLGLEMAEALAQLGARVAIAARSESELAKAQAQLEQQGAQAFTIAADLADPDGPRRIAHAAMASLGSIDILVNNAGRGWAQAAEEVTPEAWRKVMRLNVDAAYELSTEAARCSMIPRGRGRIINISSALGLRTRMPMEHRAPMAAYATSKAAVLHMTRALAAEWGRYGITVNAIAPGPFPSKMNATLADVEVDFVSRTPTGRLGRHGDLMGAAAYLASDASDHTTGQVLAIDGGMSLVM